MIFLVRTSIFGGRRPGYDQSRRTARLREILFRRQAFGVFGYEVAIRLLRLSPFAGIRMTLVQRGVDRFMEHRFLKIMIADAGLDIFGVETKKCPSLSPNAVSSPHGSPHDQRPAHEGRQPADSRGNRLDRCQCAASF